MRRWRRHSVISRWVWICPLTMRCLSWFTAFWRHSLQAHNDSKNIFKAANTPITIFIMWSVLYIFSQVNFKTQSSVLKIWIFFVLDLVSSDALPPCQPCQPLDVGPDLPWGHLGLCQVQVVRAQTKCKARSDLLVPQWRVQWGGCPDRGAHRKGVGQLLPTDSQQGKMSCFLRRCLICCAFVPLLQFMNYEISFWSRYNWTFQTTPYKHVSWGQMCFKLKTNPNCLIDIVFSLTFLT